MSTSETALPYRRKLIEVALPLEEINRESSREKSIRHGHPSTLHLWWARRPLAACRAVLFASLVDDPGADPVQAGDPAAVRKRRAELLRLIEALVKWENADRAGVIRAARAEIAACVASRKIERGELKGTDPIAGEGNRRDPVRRIATREAHPSVVNAFLARHAPPVLDPFAGGGSIPLEAQRLGLRTFALDLNPVAVLVNKALVEIPPRFAGRPPVNPEHRALPEDERRLSRFPGASGLARDVRHYGRWLRDEARRRIGHLYPRVRITPDLVRERPDLAAYEGRELTVIAWLWARTVASPNPAMGRAPIPLVRSLWLSRKKDREAYIRLEVNRARRRFELSVRSGRPAGGLDPSAGTIGRSGGTCIYSGDPVPLRYIRAEAKAGRMGSRLMAIVARGERGRIYLPPLGGHAATSTAPLPGGYPDTAIPEQALGFRVQLYGMDRHHKLFTPRQLTALVTLSDLVSVARDSVRHDDPEHDPDYADAVATYLALAVDKVVDRNTTLCTWESGMERIRGTFGRQALPMVWDFAETNPLGGAGGDIHGASVSLAEVLERLPAGGVAEARQFDATSLDRLDLGTPCLVSTDPPYYDNIGYADLSDFFYAWLRRSLSPLYPDLFPTLMTPKESELIATPFRHRGDRNAARAFFEKGMVRAMRGLRAASCPETPATVYYAFKQSERDRRTGDPTAASTGWETMLTGLIRAGFAITGTWPVRSELTTRNVGRGTNALASSIVLVCRPRSPAAETVTRRAFLHALRAELPRAIEDLTHGNVAPVDLAQAAIGPGMAVFSRYAGVLDADGTPMRVRTALELINRQLDETLATHDGDLDPATRWAVDWFAHHAHDAGPFGEALTLATAKGVSVDGLAAAGIVESRRGKVRLRKRAELAEAREPRTDRRPTAWELTHHLIHTLTSNGEAEAARRMRELASADAACVENAKELAYRLYAICEQRERAEEARGYNALVAAWPEIIRRANRDRAFQPSADRDPPRGDLGP